MRAAPFLVTALLIGLPVLAFAYGQKTAAQKVPEAVPASTSALPDQNAFESAVIDGDLASADDIADMIEAKVSDHLPTMSKSLETAQNHLNQAASPDNSVEDSVLALADTLNALSSDDGALRSFAAMIGELSGAVEVETKGDTTTLHFDGTPIGRAKIGDLDDENASLSLMGLGQMLNLKRETVQEDGKSRTRITFDMAQED